MFTRYFVAALAAVAATLAQAVDIDEGAALERALSRPALAALAQARVQAAEAAADQAGTWPNPTLELGREQVGDSRETTWRVAQSIDLSGRRALSREAALKRVEAARLEQSERRLAVVAEIRKAIAEAIAAQERGESLSRWRARLEQALAVTTKLVEAGEAAGYDRRRLEREVQAARLRADASEADAARSREILAGWVELPAAELRIRAPLLPAGAPPLETLAAGLETRPDMAALEAQAGAFEGERRAAERAWIPDLTVGAGQKQVEENGRRDSGIMLSFSVPLPLFDRGRAAAAQARSNSDAVRAERELRLAHAQRQLRGTWQQARALREAAERAAADGISGSRELSRIAETAYRGGEASLLELLDAYRAELEAETSALDLALRARMARIELDTLSGTP